MGAGGSSGGGKKGELLETMADHEESINCMCLSEDGSMLVTGSEDATARMWATKTEETECLGVLKGHSSYINCVGVHDTFVITGGADSTIRKWDMTTCECLFVYEGHTSRIQKILLTGDFIFSSSFDKTSKAWLFDVSELGEGNEERACIRTFKGHGKGVYPMIFIPAADDLGDEEETDGPNIRPGDVLVTGSADMTARSWSFESGGCLKQFRGHTGAITTMATDSSGRVLFTAGADSTIKSWNIQSGQCLKTMDGHTNAVICILVVNRLMYSGSADGSSKCWVTEFGDCTRQYKGHKGSVIAMRFQSGILWTACGDSIARAYDAKSGTLKRSYIGHEAAVNCMVITEGKLYTGSSDGTLRIWDAKDVSEELLVDDGPPPPAPIPVDEEVADPDAVVDGEELPDGESEPVEDGDGEGEVLIAEGDEVQDIEGGEDLPEEGAEEVPAEDTPAEDAPAEDEVAEDNPDAAPEENKDVDDEMEEMERELAAQG
eukprot:TRINITY_DN219_c0_g1_i1.p1 TRINITY_DN219_c0_g1~~TRINITY_DN219_c0_g1_i1.p1  ORF type:complete len:490 (-),score=146.83 TRINITY_DN219_c0_g1_i1:545-2014(-)